MHHIRDSPLQPAEKLAPGSFKCHPNRIGNTDRTALKSPIRTGGVMVYIIFLLLSVQKADTAKIEKLFESASKWRVGEAISEVDSARDELVRMGEPALEYIFSRKINTTSTLEYRAIRNITQRLLPEARPFISRCLNSDNDTILVNCISLIGDIRDTTFSDGLIELLREDRSPRVTRAAISSLGKLRCKSALPEILPYLQDTSMRIRLVVVAALGNIRDSGAIRPLMNTMLNDEFFIVRESAAHALKKLDKNAVIGAAMNELRTATNANVEATLLHLIAVLEPDSTMAQHTINSLKSMLLQKLDDENPGVRGYAALALGRVMDEEIRSRLTQQLDEEKNLFVISCIESALGRSCEK